MNRLSLSRFRKLRVLLLILAVAGVLLGTHWHYVQALVGRENNGGAASTAGHLIRQPIADTNGLVAWYPLDGDVKDYSGNGNNGTATNFTYDGTTNGYVQGKFGKALLFNGTNDYVSAGTTNLPSGSGAAYTLSAWINPTSLPASNLYSIPFSLGPVSGTDNVAVALYNNGGTQQLCAMSYNGTVQSECVNQAVVLGSWSFVTATYDGTNLAIYLNSVLLGSSTKLIDIGSSAVLSIGSWADDNYFFTGSVDDSRVYNRALSQAEVTQLYQGSPPVNCDQTCVGWWKFQELGGNTARDSALVNGNELTDVGDVASGTGIINNDAVFTSASSQYLKTTLAGAADLSPGTNSFSFSLWLNPTTIPGSGYVTVLYDGASTSTDPGFELDLLSTGKLEELLGNGTSVISATGTTVLSAGTWYHVLVTGTRSGNMVLYLNGSSNATVSISSFSAANIQQTTNPFEIGAENGAKFLNGAVDEVAVWSRALTSTEVTDIYNGGSGKNLSNLSSTETESLVSYWDMDESSTGIGAVQRNDSYAGTAQLEGFSFTPGTDGWVDSVFGNGLQFNGSSDYVVPVVSVMAGPTVFTLSAWFKTTTAAGAIIGFGDSILVGATFNYDRLLYINTSGQVTFGVYPNAFSVINSTQSYTDGKWHLATATLSSAGQVLYVDGAQVAYSANTAAYSYPVGGYWHIGANFLSGWPGAGSNYFQGSIDDVRIYNRALSISEIYDQYSAGHVE